MRHIKFLSLVISLSFLVAACNQKSKEDKKDSTDDFEPITNEVLESSVIYEANIRQYSPEGTFDEFTKDIPDLKELGVKVIWLMPVYPISMKNRKATPDLSIEDIEDPEEKKKYLGSYYAISDYTAINPEFGSIEDFDELVKTAHDNGMYVILDWVANHTGWDHKWIEEHPEYYHKDNEGNVTAVAAGETTIDVTVDADDQAGNSATQFSSSFTVDTTKPLIQEQASISLSEDSNDNDILNKETSNHDIENELLGIDNVTFSIIFTNFGPSKNMSLKVRRNNFQIADVKQGKFVTFDT
mgnify:CR=1 FL=1